MHAAARRVEEGSLDVNAEDAGHAGVERRLHRSDGAPDGLEIVADQRGHETGGAEAPMGRTDGTDGLGARVIVEQHAAAAVDLHVDEPGQQELSLDVHEVRFPAARITRIDQRLDARSREQQSPPAHDAVTGQDPAVHQGATHHTVSVTLRKCAG